jgi:hypothetical protein
MKASSVRIHAEAEPEIGAIVLGEDALGMVVVEIDARLRHLALVVFDGEALEAAIRISERQPARHGRNCYTERMHSQPTGAVCANAPLLRMVAS